MIGRSALIPRNDRGPAESDAFGFLGGVQAALGTVRRAPTLAEAVARLEGLETQAASAVDAGILDTLVNEPLPPAPGG